MLMGKYSIVSCLVRLRVGVQTPAGKIPAADSACRDSPTAKCCAGGLPQAIGGPDMDETGVARQRNLCAGSKSFATGLSSRDGQTVPMARTPRGTDGFA